MPLVDMKDMLRHAYENGYAVGAFEITDLADLKGAVEAAERCRAPVILSLNEARNETRFGRFDIDLLLPAVEAAGRRASVPIAIHFHQGRSLESAVAAINGGCNGVMVDTSQQPFPVNVEETRAVVAMARGCGVPVEGVLGPAGGNETERGGDDSGGCTSVAEAKAYIEKTDVDFLGVIIGAPPSRGSGSSGGSSSSNGNGNGNGKPRLDYQRLKQINEAVGRPLVIQGSSSLSDDQYRRLIAQGVSRIDVAATQTAPAAKEAAARTAGPIPSPRGEEAERCMRLWGSAGRAAEVLVRCRSWLPVEHVILYNVDGLDEDQVTEMMEEGRRVLGTIPGVRAVLCGRTVKDEAQYRYTWLVRFCHPAVIDSYRDHPRHVAFADQRFRPVAGSRITIDYQIVEKPLLER